MYDIEGVWDSSLEVSLLEGQAHLLNAPDPLSVCWSLLAYVGSPAEQSSRALRGTAEVSLTH